jgi:hypothetical protein
MINVREIDRTFGLWAYLAVTGCASRDAERSRSVTSHVVQLCQRADGLSSTRSEFTYIISAHWWRMSPRLPLRP